MERLGGLRDGRGRRVPLRTSTCLGPCFQANVVVVQPSSEGRERGGRPVWLGEFSEDGLIDDLGDWIREGGPGAAPLPEALAARVTSKDAEKPKKAKKAKKTKKAEKAEKKPGKKAKKAVKKVEKAAKKAKRAAKEAGAAAADRSAPTKKTKKAKKAKKG
nr:(2Fe-2S) ferredoxin domain-containing protein [Streptomonospora sp. PA3]